MSEIPSVLIADDGQLDRVVRILEAVGVYPDRVDVSKLRGESVQKPRDLLLMAWHPTRELPVLSDNPEGSEPIQVVLHSQDFLPLRDRLRQLGVDYLVQTSLDDDSLRRFLQTLLYQPLDRRLERRLPLGGRVRLGSKGRNEFAKLLDLSRSTCRMQTTRSIDVGEELTTVIPPGLGGPSELELPGEAVRCEPMPTAQGAPPESWSVLLRFGEMSEYARAQLDRIAWGEQIGTRVTPLRAAAREAAVAPEGPSAAPAPLEHPDGLEQRRQGERTQYERQVALLEVEGSENEGLGLGRDLSTKGVCISNVPVLPVGSVVTLALYGDPRSEPVVVEATVVRAGDGEMGLQMGRLDETQRRGIETLQAKPSQIESLRSESAGRRIVSRILSR